MRTKSDQASAARPPRLVYLLSVAQRRVQRSLAARSADGVSPTQAGLLFALARLDGASMGEIGHALDLGAAGTSGLVDRMTTAGLVERRTDPGDGRATRIFLTVKGRRAHERAMEIARDANALLTDGFTAEEINVVARWLTSIQSKFPKGEQE